MVMILAPDRFLLVTPAACLLLLVQSSALTALIQLPFLLATVLSAASAAVVILTLHGLRLQVYRPIQCSEYRGELCAWPWMKNLDSNAVPLLAISSYTQLSLSAKRQLPWVDRMSRHLALFPPPQFRICQLAAPPAGTYAA
ncbi:hypothetical protein IWW34DRAFT_347872 [Fusarium oxysporum f. sp. albedinis]|nr:hypothetical protein IWW34DRAFT_347872 [Fusarium oxysporum f. sp. albedinis]